MRTDVTSKEVIYEYYMVNGKHRGLMLRDLLLRTRNSEGFEAGKGNCDEGLTYYQGKVFTARESFGEIRVKFPHTIERNDKEMILGLLVMRIYRSADKGDLQGVTSRITNTGDGLYIIDFWRRM